MNRCIKRIVPNDINTRITYTGHKLNTRFQIKDKTAQIHKEDLVYYVKCPDQSCNQDYLGETARRIIERTADHSTLRESIEVLRGKKQKLDCIFEQ